MAGTQDGAIKTAAKLAGVPYDEYVARIASGEKLCQICQVWHSVLEFGKDSSRWDGLTPLCRRSKNEREQSNYLPKVRTKPPGPDPHAPREGDKLQARMHINALVKRAGIPHPNKLACVDCGHLGDERRHEYDHYLGYAAEHHYDVQPVCTTCHARRGVERGEAGCLKPKNVANRQPLSGRKRDKQGRLTPNQGN